MSKCKNCGANYGLHRYETEQCPKNGTEEMRIDRNTGAYLPQQWESTKFEPIPTKPIRALTFGQAIDLMKQGERLQRKGWNGKGMFVFLEKEFKFLIPAGKFAGKERKYEPVLCLKNAQGTTQPGWLASQADMLATDWQLYED